MYTDFRQKHLNEGALAAFGRAAELSPTPTTWNNVAYQLALKGAYLDRAQQYAESALSAVAIDSRNFTIGHITARELAITQSIASHLDTLGWVAFAKGDLAQAEKLIEAAWWIVENGEIGRVHQRRREAQANVGRAESAPVSGSGYSESAGEGGAVCAPAADA